jgi:hypothetical protein
VLSGETTDWKLQTYVLESFMLLASMSFRVMTRHEKFHCSFCSRTSCPGIEVLSLEWAPEENAPNTAYQKQTNVQLSSAFYFLVFFVLGPLFIWTAMKQHFDMY